MANINLFSNEDWSSMRVGFYCVALLYAAVNCAQSSEPQILWSASFPYSEGSIIWDISTSSSGNHIAVGEVSTGPSGESALNLSGLNQDGLLLWENTALSLGNASAYSIEAVSDGFVVCGESSDSLGTDGLILKIDASGNTVWRVDVGYEDYDALLDLCILPGGNITAVGYSYNLETQDNDVFAVCVSDSGSVLWRKRYVYPFYQTAYSLTLSNDSDSELIITGADNGDVFLMKIDQQGNWLWKTSHLLEGNQTGRCLTSVSEGGYIVAGSTRGRNGFSDALIVYFDDDGRAVNDDIWGSDGPDNAYSIIEIKPAGFVVLVNSNSGTGEGYRPLILRYDLWLSIIWSVEITDRDALAYSLRQTEDGGFIVTGQSSFPDRDAGYSSCVFRLSPEDLLNWD